MKLGYFIQKTSKSSVIEGVELLRRFYIPRQQLLSKNNPLEKNDIKALRKHADPTLSYTISNNDFKTYLAASSLAHALDGWMYLSNSFNALLNGDEGTAIHLAYYAELRSAMALLATEGVGVFDKKHYGTFAGNYCPIFKYRGKQGAKGATHQFVWNAIDKWSNSANKPNDEILKIFKVRGINFYDIVEFFHPSTAGSTLLTVATVKSWLKDWCFDIKNYRDDRKNRNDVSYRPQRIKNFNTNLDFKSIINELNSYWELISPVADDKFRNLDTYLLRKLFANLYASIQTSTSKRDLIESAFIQQGINDITLFNFLDFQAPYNNDHIIFQQAAIKRNGALPIISRATLLLRITLGLVSQLFKTGGVNKNELNFIWNNYAEDNGFWINGQSITDFNLLWTNIQPSLNDLSSYINTPNNGTSIHSICEKNPQEIIFLSQINRACLWGLDF